MEGNLMENNTIVVARFKEDLEWLNKLIESELWIERVVIFNKGPENISFSKKALKKNRDNKKREYRKRRRNIFRLYNREL